MLEFDKETHVYKLEGAVIPSVTQVLSEVGFVDTSFYQEYHRWRGQQMNTRGSMKSFTIPGAPVPKPRQTRADKWKQRPCVVRYRAWADEARLRAGRLPADALMVTLRFYLPMPTSWTGNKQELHRGRFHDQAPDLDNLIKAANDALWPKGDQKIASIDAAKFWTDKKNARTEIRIN